ncbi:MAG TPA: hypothetical protein VEQ41_02315 [Solirubrobacterales bacterium]|nr:hypothetical protein [Solirubrobacterales bacterium]
MRIKLKGLGVGLLLTLATSAVTGINAGAETGGHFVSSGPKTTITGIESGTHNVHLVSEGGADGQRIGCDKDTYTGSLSGGTATQITIKPDWIECYTTGNPATEFNIHENGCEILFTVGNFPSGHNTAHLVCSSAGILITHTNCGIRIPPQTVTGVSYKNQGDPHEITLSVTIKKITSHYHTGPCIFLGTVHTSELNGYVTVRGSENLSIVSITALG